MLLSAAPTIHSPLSPNVPTHPRHGPPEGPRNQSRNRLPHAQTAKKSLGNITAKKHRDESPRGEKEITYLTTPPNHTPTSGREAKTTKQGSKTKSTKTNSTRKKSNLNPHTGLPKRPLDGGGFNTLQKDRGVGLPPKTNKKKKKLGRTRKRTEDPFHVPKCRPTMEINGGGVGPTQTESTKLFAKRVIVLQ